MNNPNKLFSQKSVPLITIKTEQKSNSFPSSPLETVEYTWEYVMPPPIIPVRLSVLYPRSRQPIGLYVSLFGSVCGSCYYSMSCSDICRKWTVVEVYRLTNASMFHTCQVSVLSSFFQKQLLVLSVGIKIPNKCLFL